MSELSPIDKSILELLESSRQTVEQSITDRAQSYYDSYLEADETLEVGGLLMKECERLRGMLLEREKYYVDANWLQRRRLKKLGQMTLPIKMTVGGRETPLTKFQERASRHNNIKRVKRFQVKGIFPVESEASDVGSLKQDWVVSTEPFFIHTYLRASNEDVLREESLTKVHKISLLGDQATVYEDNELVNDDEYYLPLGLIMEAGRIVQKSVPTKVSKHW